MNIPNKTLLLKTIIWRVLSTIINILLAWVVTGSVEHSLKIGGLDVIFKLLLYFIHEKVWNKQLIKKNEKKILKD